MIERKIQQSEWLEVNLLYISIYTLSKCDCIRGFFLFIYIYSWNVVPGYVHLFSDADVQCVLQSVWSLNKLLPIFVVQSAEPHNLLKQSNPVYLFMFGFLFLFIARQTVLNWKCKTDTLRSINAGLTFVTGNLDNWCNAFLI